MAGGAAPGPPGPPLFRLFSSGDPVVPSHPRVAGMRTPTVGAPRREGGPAPLSPSDRCGAHLRDGKGPPRAGAPTAGASGVQADWVPLPLRVPGSWGRLGLPSFGGGGPGACPALLAVGPAGRDLRPARSSGSGSPPRGPKTQGAARLSRAKHVARASRGALRSPAVPDGPSPRTLRGAGPGSWSLRRPSVGPHVPPSRWSLSNPCCPPCLGRRLLL